MGEITTERKRMNNQPGLFWEVTDKNTGRGYRLVPGAETENAPADTFAVADFWVLKYKPEELDDNGQPGPACAIKINPFINNNSLDQDLVVWYRTGVRHLGHDLDHCHIVGPTLVPIGDWSP
jgi:Cu2+-containing amine oxidase